MTSAARASGLLLLLTGLVSCTRAPADEAAGSPPVPEISADAAPVYQVDPYWPKELPNRWIIGEIRGLYVDSRDHIWVLHRPGNLSEREQWAASEPPGAECCIAAPPVVEFDPEGNVVQAWGGPGEGYVWPEVEHGIYVDHTDHVWTGTNTGYHVMKFTRDGKPVLMIGGTDPGAGSNDPTRLGGPAAFHVDPATNDLFIADGYINSRVIVFDAETGAYRRHWGAYGEPPVDVAEEGEGDYDPAATPARFFRTAHGLVMSTDGLLYVTDRGNDRIQVFRPSGEFVMEQRIAPETRASGSTFSVALSHDAAQTYVYLTDGSNNKVRILRRSDLVEVGQFGHAGRQAGQFVRAHVLDTDSNGNLYTGEAGDGKRVQKFVLRR